jgi:ATP-binding cassette subfamily B protein
MRNYLRLLHYARPQRKVFAFVGALTAVAAALSAAQPWPVKLLLDRLQKIASGVSAPAQTLTPAFLAIIVLAGLGLFVLNALVDAGLTWAWTSAGRRMVYDLAEDLFARLQRRSLPFHSRTTVGDSLSRVTVDSWSIYQLADRLLFSPMHALLSIAAMIFLMARLDGRMTLLAVATAPAMIAASFLLGKPLRAAARLKREIESRIQAHIQQTLTGIPVVQAFAQEERENLRFRGYADAVIRSQQRSALLGSVNSLGSGLITTLGSGIILWIGARHVLAGALSLGSIFVFLVYLNSLQGQMKVFAGLYTTLQSLSATVNRTVEVLDAAPDLPEKPQATTLPRVRGEVEFRSVTAGYEPGRPILENINLRTAPGESIGIVGATGAGKTTLVNLLPRFMDPWEGRVLIDGHDLRDIKLKTVRDQIGLVLQESYLFPISIAENVAYGRPDATREEIAAAARAANAHDFILALPEGYDTIIGERGATLSGGERQRLAIARALLKNPPILILDEPTSALDSQTESLILQALERLMKDRTTFIIAHRLSTIRNADRIILLKQGQIVEQGSHQELVDLCGDYFRLHHLQQQSHLPLPAAVLG